MIAILNLLFVGAAALGAASPGQPPRLVTFNKDIAPIVFMHCSTCHRSGEVGPFNLLTYQDVRQRANQIVGVTARRIMPPWKPTAPTFLDQRVLTEHQIQLLADWVAQGAVEGDARDLPPLPTWPGDNWRLGTPDLIVNMPEPYVVPADGQDSFRTFVIPIPLKAARYVKGLEFHPGNPRAVHHANLGVDRTSSSRRLDELDPEPGYFGGILPDANYPPGQMLGWTPGQTPRPSPEGTQWRLSPGDDLVIQLHMQPTGKREPVRASVGLFFSDVAPDRTAVGLRLGSETIDIAPGVREFVVADSYVLPIDAEVIAIQPHAHNLARRMEAVATLPDATRRTLIAIGDWDFRWQEVYRYTSSLVLPKGTKIAMQFTYDNSAANPRNPHAPPQRIVWGQNTSNEMGDLWLQVIPRSSDDASRLNADIGRKMRREDIAANLKLLQGDPSNSTRHDMVAVLLLQDGQGAQAIPYLRSSLRLRPGYAPAHYNLGLALTAAGQIDDAFREYSEAIRIDPRHAEAHNSLGALLHAQGKLDEAIGHYRIAAALRPDNAGVRANLGQALFAQGQASGALGEFRETLRINPDSIPALTGLAWILAASADANLRNADEAIRLAERGVALTRQRDASALDALAAAYASAGRFDRAIAAARSAAALTVGRSELAAQIRQRLALYESGMPFRIP